MIESWRGERKDLGIRDGRRGTGYYPASFPSLTPLWNPNAWVNNYGEFIKIHHGNKWLFLIISGVCMYIGSSGAYLREDKDKRKNELKDIYRYGLRTIPYMSEWRSESPIHPAASFLSIITPLHLPSFLPFFPPLPERSRRFCFCFCFPSSAIDT